MASVLEEYLVRFGFDVKTEGLDRMVSGLNASKKLLSTIREPFMAFNEAVEGLGRLGYLVSAPFRAVVNLSTAAAHTADELNDMSKALGLSMEQLQFFGYVAEENGSSAGSMQQALVFLNKEIANASNGNKESIASFKKFGIEVHNVDGTLKQAGDVMTEVLAHLETIPDEGKRAAAGMELFSKAGLNIRNVLGVTTAELAELRLEFELLGGRTPEKLKHLGEAYGDSVNRIRTFSQGLQNWFAMGFQPIINGFMKWVEEFARKWGPTLRLTLYQIGDAMFNVAKVVGAGVDTFAQAFGVIIRNLDVLLPLFLLWEYRAVGAALKTAAAWAMAVGPFVLAFLAIEDLFAFLEGKESVIGDIADLWEGWTGEMSKSHPVLAGIMQFITEIFSNALLSVRAFWQAFTDGGIFGFLNEVGTAVGVAFSYYVDTLGNFVNEGLDYLGVFGDAVRSTWDFVGSTLQAASETVVAFWQAFKDDGVLGFLTEVGSAIATAFGYYKDIVLGFIQTMGDAVGGLSSLVDRAFAPVRSAMSALGIGGSAPQVQPSTGSVTNMGSSVSNSNTEANANITVNSQPGMNERELAQKTAASFKEMFKSELRSAHPDVAYAR